LDEPVKSPKTHSASDLARQPPPADGVGLPARVRRAPDHRRSLGDRSGRKRLFLASVGVFGAPARAASLSRRPAERSAARVVQDAGAAVMAPQVLATFRVIFSGRERGKALALDGAMAGFASAIRLILGGVLSDANLFGRRWPAVFFLNVPVALVTLAVPAQTPGGASGLSSTAQRRRVLRRAPGRGAAVLRAGDGHHGPRLGL
jgi:MFS family permease